MLELLRACSARKGATRRQRSGREGAAPSGQRQPRERRRRCVPAAARSQVSRPTIAAGLASRHMQARPPRMVPSQTISAGRRSADRQSISPGHPPRRRRALGTGAHASALTAIVSSIDVAAPRLLQQSCQQPRGGCSCHGCSSPSRRPADRRNSSTSTLWWPASEALAFAALRPSRGGGSPTSSRGSDHAFLASCSADPAAGALASAERGPPIGARHAPLPSTRCRSLVDRSPRPELPAISSAPLHPTCLHAAAPGPGSSSTSPACIGSRQWAQRRST
jgi:hypothetical protein